MSYILTFLLGLFVGSVIGVVLMAVVSTKGPVDPDDE